MVPNGDEASTSHKRGEHATQIRTPYWKCLVFYDDDDDYSIQYREYLENSSNAITPDSPTKEPDKSLSMRDEHLDTIPETESNEEKAVTFSNPLFNSNDDFTSNDDESLSDEDIPEDNVKIYLNPLFKFNEVYISSDVNPLFYEVLKNIKSKNSYDFNLDEPDLLVNPLFDVNKDEGDILYLESLLSDDTTPTLPPEVFLDRDLRSLSDELNINDLMTEDKVFDPRIHDQSFSLTYDCLDFEASRARGFVYHSLKILSLAYGNPIS
nr:hypothetical protein [Tanacetum cinerariifolium]